MTLPIETRLKIWSLAGSQENEVFCCTRLLPDRSSCRCNPTFQHVEKATKIHLINQQALHEMRMITRPTRVAILCDFFCMTAWLKSAPMDDLKIFQAFELVSHRAQHPIEVAWARLEPHTTKLRKYYKNVNVISQRIVEEENKQWNHYRREKMRIKFEVRELTALGEEKITRDLERAFRLLRAYMNPQVENNRES